MAGRVGHRGVLPCRAERLRAAIPLNLPLRPSGRAGPLASVAGHGAAARPRSLRHVAGGRGRRRRPALPGRRRPSTTRTGSRARCPATGAPPPPSPTRRAARSTGTRFATPRATASRRAVVAGASTASSTRATCGSTAPTSATPRATSSPTGSRSPTLLRARGEHLLAVEVDLRPRRPHRQAQPHRRVPALGLPRPGLEPRRHLAAGAARHDRAGAHPPLPAALPRGRPRSGPSLAVRAVLDSAEPGPSPSAPGSAGRSAPCPAGQPRRRRGRRRRAGAATVPIEREHPLATGENRVELTVPVPEPDLWWPHALGDQPLYDVGLDVRRRRRRSATGTAGASACARSGCATGSPRSTASGCSSRASNRRAHPRWRSPRPAPRSSPTTSRLAARRRARPPAGPRPHQPGPSSTTRPTRPGMLLWQDLPLQWGYSPQASASRPGARPARRSTCSAHHPSLLVWCGHNEPMAIDTEPAACGDPHGPAAPRRRRLARRPGAAHVEPDDARPLGQAEPSSSADGTRPGDRPLRRAPPPAAARRHRHATSTSAGTTATSATCPAAAAGAPPGPLRHRVRRPGRARRDADVDCEPPSAGPTSTGTASADPHALAEGRVRPPRAAGRLRARFDAWRQATQQLPGRGRPPPHRDAAAAQVPAHRRLRPVLLRRRAPGASAGRCSTTTARPSRPTTPCATPAAPVIVVADRLPPSACAPGERAGARRPRGERPRATIVDGLRVTVTVGLGRPRRRAVQHWSAGRATSAPTPCVRVGRSTWSCPSPPTATARARSSLRGHRARCATVDRTLGDRVTPDLRRPAGVTADPTGSRQVARHR